VCCGLSGLHSVGGGVADCCHVCEVTTTRSQLVEKFCECSTMERTQDRKMVKIVPARDMFVGTDAFVKGCRQRCDERIAEHCVKGAVAS